MSRGKKIFIIAVMFYRELAKILTKAGFVKGRDFIDGSDFFKISNYVSLEMVKSM